MSAPLKLWDGKWTVAKPADYTPGLYRWHQITAFELLKSGVQLDEWAATFLQTVAYQTRDLTPLQAHWLRRVERDHGSLAA